MEHSELAALVDAFDDVLTSTLDLVRTLPESSADLPTDCPGWTVRDQLSHMVGLEQTLSGSPEPAGELPPLAHVSSPLDEYMERPVEARRHLPLAAIADELAGLLPRRRAQMHAALDAGDGEVLGPMRTAPLSRVVPTRVFDLWAHEQDIRRAVGLPPRTTGHAAFVSVQRALGGWAGVLPDRVDGVDAVLVIEVEGRTDLRAEIVLGAGGEPTTIAADLGTLTWLACGRGALSAASGVRIDGDRGVVDAVAPHLGFTP